MNFIKCKINFDKLLKVIDCENYICFLLTRSHMHRLLLYFDIYLFYLRVSPKNNSRFLLIFKRCQLILTVNKRGSTVDEKLIKVYTNVSKF